MSGWIGVDFDGTLSLHYKGLDIGAPIQPMVDRVKYWLANGIDVRIFTARAALPDQAELVARWCEEHIGQRLQVTDRKDFNMIELWDDRAIQVIRNTGEPVK